MYTTACEACRRVRTKCVRPSRGLDQDEKCDRCLATDSECVTVKRRVGRQRGVKNRKTRMASALSEQAALAAAETAIPGDADHLPNPLHVLASEAMRRQITPDAEDSAFVDSSTLRTSRSIVDRYAEWTEKVHATEGRDELMRRLDELIAKDKSPSLDELEEPSVFSGRIDMPRPDACPENDLITLGIISATDAQQLFDSFIRLITNGSMYFDPRLHTMSFVRCRSSFLLAVILAVASTYTSLCPSSRLHVQLMAHAEKLEAEVRKNHLKSIEIIQAFLLLASWSEVPSSLCRDKTWMYVCHAIALAVELRLDTPLPHCVQTDPLYDPSKHDLLVRNSHRLCLLMLLHDRNMAMVAGRYHIYPESPVMSAENLDRWGKHALASRFDASICASVALRKTVTATHLQLERRGLSNFTSDYALIEKAMSEWRTKWAVEIQTTHEYDIIARFSTFVLVLTLVRKKQRAGAIETEARRACEVLAFEVCCAAINHYKSWTGLLNSATFDTSMVAFCAIYTIQSINHLASEYLSDWSLFQLATLQELILELEAQAAERHPTDSPRSMSVVDAMAKQLSRGIRILLSKKRTGQPPQSVTSEMNLPPLLDHEGAQAQDLLATPQLLQFDELSQFMFSNGGTNGFGNGTGGLPMGFMPEWNLDGMLPDMGFPSMDMYSGDGGQGSRGGHADGNGGIHAENNGHMMNQSMHMLDFA
ncbi:hypothetical protein IAT38_001764 [Cryptococcus sp. DSM 104549]